MSVGEETQTSVDTETAARSRMEGQPRSSQKHLLLQVWCGLLTMSLVAMAAFVASIKSKPAIKTGTQENSSSPAASALFLTKGPVGMPPSYIELMPRLHDMAWEKRVSCELCSLFLRHNSVHVNSSSSAPSVFFFYAQVVFRNVPSQVQTVKLIINEWEGKKGRILVEVPVKEGRLVWIGRMVRLAGGDSVRLNITGGYHRSETFWGAFQLH